MRFLKGSGFEAEANAPPPPPPKPKGKWDDVFDRIGFRTMVPSGWMASSMEDRDEERGTLNLAYRLHHWQAEEKEVLDPPWAHIMVEFKAFLYCDNTRITDYRAYSECFTCSGPLKTEWGCGRYLTNVKSDWGNGYVFEVAKGRNDRAYHKELTRLLAVFRRNESPGIVLFHFWAPAKHREAFQGDLDSVIASFQLK